MSLMKSKWRWQGVFEFRMSNKELRSVLGLFFPFFTRNSLFDIRDSKEVTLHNGPRSVSVASKSRDGGLAVGLA